MKEMMLLSQFPPKRNANLHVSGPKRCQFRSEMQHQPLAYETILNAALVSGILRLKS